MVKLLVRSTFLAILYARIVNCQLAETCAATVAEAPQVCIGAIAGALLAWGIEEAVAAAGSYVDNQRIAFIQNFVENVASNYPSMNVMVVATYHNVPGENSGIGSITGNCGHSHKEISLSGGWSATQGFEIYLPAPGASCCVEKWGDGGWSNWGYYGGWSRSVTPSGSQVMCVSAPPPPPPPSSIGSMKYSISRDQVTVNGIVGNLVREGFDGGYKERLYSTAPGYTVSSIQEFQNGQSGAPGPWYVAAMQTDGNFVVYYYTSSGRTPIFWTDTGGHTNNQYWVLYPQHDGNLVVYPYTPGVAGFGSPVWASGTYGYNPKGGQVGLSMQQNGDCVLYAFYGDGSCDPIWGTFGQAPFGQRMWPY